MKLATIAAALLAAITATAQGIAIPSVMQTLYADGTTNHWTEADLVLALQLMNRKYHREMETHAGRMAWHGKLVNQTVDTNALIKVDWYEDGFAWTNKWTAPSPATPKAAAARAAAARRERAAALAAQKDGVPAGAADARGDWNKAAGSVPEATNVTITVGAGGKQ